MTTARQAVLLSFLERYTSVLVYAVANVVLSRLLTPHDTGLFTIGFALTVMIGTFRDFGVSTYVLQEAELTDVKWRSALGVSIVSCAVVFAAVVVAGFVAGWAYGDPDVTAVMLVSGLTLLLIPFNAMILAWLRREMRFGVLYRLSLLCAATQTVVTVMLAASGHGAMSMAWGSVANSAVILVGSIRLRPRQFGYVPSLAAWRPIAGLGVYSTIAAICTEITPNAADLLIGRFGGLVALGLFSKAGSLVGFVNQGLTSAVLPVALALFAQQRRRGEDLAGSLPHALGLLTGIAWPLFAGLAVVAAPAIRLLFGPQWQGAVAPARLVLIAAMVTVMTGLHASAFQAAGAMRARMIVQLAATPLQLAVLYAAAHGTLVHMAIGSIASAVIEFVPSQIMMNRMCRTRLRAVGLALWPSAVVTICTIAGPLCLPAGAALPVAIAAGGLGWLVGLAVTRHPLGSEVLAVIPARRRRAAALPEAPLPAGGPE